MSQKMFPIAILAGGLATRLHPLTEKTPKALIDIEGKPFIAYQLRLLQQQGFKQVVLCINFLGEQIVNYVDDGRQFDLEVQYSFDGESQLGTAGALEKALPLLGENFFVLYGDSYLSCQYAAVQQAFVASQKMALMAIFKNEGRWDKSNVVWEDNQIKVYDKSYITPSMQYIDYGLGVFNQSAFSLVKANERFDLALLYQQLLQKKELEGYEMMQRFYEVGSHSGIKEFQQFIQQTTEPV